MDTKRSPFLTETFRAFTVDTEPEEAKRYFKKLYGYEPEHCEVWKGVLCLGPIKKKEDELDTRKS